MSNSEETTRTQLEKQKPEASHPELAKTDQALESEATAFEGKVAEVAKTSVGENKPVGQQQGDGQAQKSGASDDELKDDRAALKAKLLRKAPKENVMRKQVERKLLKKKDKLRAKLLNIDVSVITICWVLQLCSLGL